MSNKNDYYDEPIRIFEIIHEECKTDLEYCKRMRWFMNKIYERLDDREIKIYTKKMW